jgi:glycosyltransferase involved in cell wall biosynthesis
MGAAEEPMPPTLTLRGAALPEGAVGDVDSAAAGNPIRVCLVGPSLDILGGQAVQLERLMAGLRGVPGLEVSFVPVNPRLPGPFRRLQGVKYLRTIVTSLAYGFSLLRQVRRCDVIHAFSASYWSFMLAPLPAMLVARLYGKGVVLNYHSGEADDHLTRWRRSAVPSMRLAHAIVVPTSYLVEVFARHGLRATAIANSLDPARFPWRARTAPRPRFLSNRNLEPLYNVSCTLRAFARIQRELPDASLVVAGDGSERAALAQLAAELRLTNVQFLGRVDPERMPALYEDADVYLNSPNIDNMPLSILEAFAAGLPVVTTNAGGIPYIVRDGVNGLMVQSDDHKALAAAGLRLLREPHLAARLAERAREECLSTWVWPAVAPAWNQLYHRVSTQARARVPGASESRL